MALFGMPSNLAVPGSWMMTRPPLLFMASIPFVPSVPVPDNIIAMARLLLSFANE
jgi:hypothetical protein